MKIIFLTILCSLFCCTTVVWAADLPFVRDSLRKELHVAQSRQDSVTLLYHLIDVSSRQAVVPYYRCLYSIAEQANNIPIQLDLLRIICNHFLQSDSIMAICLKEAERLPISNAQQEAIAYIKINRIALQARVSSEEERMVTLQKVISEYKQDKSDHLYNDIVQLYYVCLYLSQSTTGELYLEYMEKLEQLIKQLPEDSRYVLPNLFYTQASIIYTNNEAHEKAIEATKNILKIIEQLTAQYVSQGRIFRNYDTLYYSCYRRILNNYPALLPEEIEDYFQWIQVLCQKNRIIKADYNRSRKVLIFYLMATQQYTKALSELKTHAQSFKDLTERKTYLRLLTEAAREAKDDKTLLMATTEYNDILEECNKLKAAEKYRELQILYDVNELKNSNAQLELEKRDVELASNQRTLHITLLAIGILAVLLVFVLLLYRRSNKLAKSLQRSKQKLQQEQRALLQTQDELTIARDQAESANKMKTVFLQNMSHEIRTPLNAIVGFSEVLIDSLDEEHKKEAQTYTELISSNSELLVTLVGDILDLAQMETGEIQPNFTTCSVHYICQLVIKNIEHRVLPNVKMYFTSNGLDDRSLVTDAIRLEQVLINFLTNATKYTKEGEIVLSYSIDTSENEIIFAVTDTGIGIPAEKAEIIFERFEKLDSFVQGTGVGLHICKLIAHMLEGEVMLDTSYTKGARFLFKHPLSKTID